MEGWLQVHQARTLNGSCFGKAHWRATLTGANPVLTCWTTACSGAVEVADLAASVAAGLNGVGGEGGRERELCGKG